MYNPIQIARILLSTRLPFIRCPYQTSVIMKAAPERLRHLPALLRQPIVLQSGNGFSAIMAQILLSPKIQRIFFRTMMFLTLPLQYLPQTAARIPRAWGYRSITALFLNLRIPPIATLPAQYK